MWNGGNAKERYGSSELYDRIQQDALLLIESMGMKASPGVVDKIRAALDPGEAAHLIYAPEVGRFYISEKSVEMCMERVRQGFDYWPAGFGTGGMAAYVVDANGPRTAALDDITRLAQIVARTDEYSSIQTSFNPCSKIKKSDAQKRREIECAGIDLMIRYAEGKLVTPTIRNDESIRYLAGYYDRGYRVGAALSIVSTFLTVSEEMVDPFIETVKANVPFLMNSMPIAGLTGPYSTTSLVTLAHAEALFGMCLAQLIRPGIKIVNAAMPTVADVKRKDMPLRFGSLSNTLINILLAELNAHLGLPTCQSACAHSRDIFDEEAVKEASITYTLINRFQYHMLRHPFGYASQLNDFNLDTMEQEIELYRRICRNPVPGVDPKPAEYDDQGLEAIMEGVSRGDFRNLDHTLKNVGCSFCD
jgi:trimethylamine:corrinoid methyltransferase-like protein